MSDDRCCRTGRGRLIRDSTLCSFAGCGVKNRISSVRYPLFHCGSIWMNDGIGCSCNINRPRMVIYLILKVCSYGLDHQLHPRAELRPRPPWPQPRWGVSPSERHWSSSCSLSFELSFRWRHRDVLAVRWWVSKTMRPCVNAWSGWEFLWYLEPCIGEIIERSDKHDHTLVKADIKMFKRNTTLYKKSKMKGSLAQSRPLG